MAAAVAASRALNVVPAYADFVANHGGRPRASRPTDYLAELPIADKSNYIDAYPVAARCRYGEIPPIGVELDESSGSSGRPYTWVRSAAELREVHRTMELLVRHLLVADAPRDVPVITLNGFSMGAWATGTNVSRAMRRLGAVKSTGPEPEKILPVLDLMGPGYTYLIAGYPPFLRTLLEVADSHGFDLSGYRLFGFVGGEGMTEALRTRLERTFRSVYSAYGASDLDIGVAAEFPLTVWLRQQVSERPELAEVLFGTRSRLPMIFQYDPTDYYVETVEGEPVVTVCRSSMLSPRIRYNVHDSGGALSFAHVVMVCRDFGLDPVLGATSRSAAPIFRLPFLYIHGRSDSTISVHGANIYPEDVERGLGEALGADLMTAFMLDIDEQDAGVTRPLVHVETTAPGTPGLAERFAHAVRERLLTNSADFRAATAENVHSGQVLVRLHSPGTGPFAENANRLKRRYIRKTGDK